MSISLLAHKIVEHKALASIATFLTDLITSETIQTSDHQYNYAIEISIVCTTSPKITATTTNSTYIKSEKAEAIDVQTSTKIPPMHSMPLTAQPSNASSDETSSIASNDIVHFLVSNSMTETESANCCRCNECAMEFKNQPDLFWHLRYRHLALLQGIEAANSGQCFGCHLCARTFKCLADYRAHYRHGKHELLKAADDVTAGRLQCHKCNNGKTYSSNNALMAHIDTHSEVRPYLCDICSKAFKRQDSLDCHMELHVPMKAHICQLCGDSFQQISGLRQHILKRHDREHLRYKCDLCPKQYTTRQSLRYYFCANVL